MIFLFVVVINLPLLYSNTLKQYELYFDKILYKISCIYLANTESKHNCNKLNCSQTYQTSKHYVQIFGSNL